MEVSAGVVVRERDRVKKGPKKVGGVHVNLFNPSFLNKLNLYVKHPYDPLDLSFKYFLLCNQRTIDINAQDFMIKHCHSTGSFTILTYAKTINSSILGKSARFCL